MPFLFGRSDSAVLDAPAEKIELNDTTLEDLLNSWRLQGNIGMPFYYSTTRGSFQSFIDEHTTNSEDLGWCANCYDPVVEGDENTVEHEDHFYCDTCWAGFYQCNDCEIVCIRDYFDVDDNVVCRSCYDAYSYCEDCDVYYHSDNASEHDHPSDCDCESPAQKFNIRNNTEIVANDTRFEITLPSGVIDDEGIAAICSYLNELYYELYRKDQDNAYTNLQARSLVITTLDPQWQTKTGNFTKRLSRELHKKYSKKLPKEVLSEIGNIARQHTNTTATYSIEATRQLNLDASEFFHSESCWWQSYYASRCTLKSNGGFGIRTFDEYGDVSGRAWVMPMKKDANDYLNPTSNAEDPDAFVVFNGYGELSGYTGARIMSQLSGMTYRKTSFYVSGMYVNDDSGYIIAPEDLAEKIYKRHNGIEINTTAHSNLYIQETNNV
jgi:hypothetical protein